MHTIQIHLEVVDVMPRRSDDVDNEVQITAYDQSLAVNKRVPLFTFTCLRRQLRFILEQSGSTGFSGSFVQASLGGKMLSSLS